MNLKMVIVSGKLYKTAADWKKLPRKVVDSPFVEVFKNGFGKALGNLV